MKEVKVEEAVNAGTIRPGHRIYCSGNAATPQVLLKQLCADTGIRDVEMLSALLLGDISSLFVQEACQRITHRIIFNGPYSRKAVNEGRARYQILHLSDIPRQVRKYLQPDVVFLTVSGPDKGGNYSLGTTVEGVLAAVYTAKENNRIVIAERNRRMPFVLGTTIHETAIDFLVDSDYDLPLSRVKVPDERARKIADIISALFVTDGCTLQYGIGEVPEAVTEAIIRKGTKDLGIRTELFSDAMRKLVEKGLVTNRYLTNRFSIATVFLSGSREGYDWYHYNSSLQSRPSDRTNGILHIAAEPKMVAINSALGVDLHGNIWADSIQARNIYSGVGGQADFLRGAYLSPGGIPIIALKSTTHGLSKIVDKSPEGITTTAIPADPVVLVTEHGAFDPRGLSITEHAVGIAHLAAPEHRDKLLQHIFESKVFNKPAAVLRGGRPKGFIPYEDI
ncbi:MAG: acetyl-CoA hydrolase/transferase family protein [Deltaproteobacteria bacterium]|nr:acetyl-CoA hydrolase/transferase family protein [Deltaproteobacteria bacterium]